MAPTIYRLRDVKKKYLTHHLTSCILSGWRYKTMEKIVEQTLLYDFYGELLTVHQREVYEDVVLGDLGYSEAAEELGVSRQGIHDLVKRVDRQLAGYEEKLHLVERFLKIQEDVTQIRELAAGDSFGRQQATEVTQICDRILNEL